MNQHVLSHRQYLAIALPFILSTVTQPLLGAVGIGIVGKLSNPIYIAGVSVGTVIFDTMYWLFGFLRVGTTAFSAQAKSKDDEISAFFRPLTIALLVGIIFILFRNVIFHTSMGLLSPEQEVQVQIGLYFYILVFGAPFVLCNYVILGWLMGRAFIKESMFMQISGNVLNILLDVAFVYIFKMDVKGVAWATFISQIYTSVIGVFFMMRNISFGKIEIGKMIEFSEMSGILRVNSDLMLRTVCLLIQTNLFTASSASFGTAVLSSNAILLQIQSVISYMFDGLANASSVCAGRAVGQRNEELMKLTWKRTMQWSIVLAIVTTTFFWLAQSKLLLMFTDLPSLIAIARQYIFWVALYPFLSGGGLAFYGVFTGSAETKAVRNSTFFSLLLFIAIRFLAVPILGNHGIWLALLVFYFGRTVFLLPHLHKTLDIINSKGNKTF